MWRLTVRNTLARRARLALTLLAVLLGVTFVTGSLVLTDTSQKLLDDQFRTASADVDLTVRAAAAFDSAMGVEVERDPVPAALLDRVRAVAGVAAARPQVRGQGLLEVDGAPVVPSGPSLLASWAPTPFGAFTLRSGVAPAAAGEVVVDVATARAHGIEIGDTVTVRADDSAELRVVGLAGFGTADGLPDSTVALVDLAAARQLLRLDGGASEIAVVAAADIDRTVLRDRLAAAVGPGYAVSASTDVAAASAAAAKNQLGYLRIMLLALAAAALLVGAFLIANTFSIVIAQRTRELAVLRAAGATERQVLGSVLGEALLVGVLASAAGVALGVAAGAGLRSLVAVFGIDLPSGGIVVTTRTVLVAFGVGMLVTALSALGPARRAARVAPVEAMRQSAGGVPVGRTRTVAGAGLTVLGMVALGAVLSGSGPVALLAAGAVAVVAGLALLGPALAPALAGFVGRPLDLGGVPGRMARRSAARAPRRTAATALALAVGLALITFMTVVAASVKDSITQSYSETISADLVVESGRNEMLGGLPPTLASRIAALPQVAVASRLRYGHWKDAGATRALTAVDPATLPRVASVRLVAGNLDALDGGGIVLAERAARQRGVGVGDRVAMTFSRTGTQNLPVVGLLRDRDAQALSTDYVISLGTFARHFAEDVDASVFVALADGVDAAAGRAALDAVLAEAPTAQVRDQAAAVAGRTRMVDQVLGLVSALLMFTIVIALLGVTNTLALSIVERTREIGLLRAVGTTRRQVGWMIRGEAVLVTALASVGGLGLGVAFAAGTVAALGRTGTMWLTLPTGRLLLVAAVAALAGLLAGLLPARRAAGLDVLTAIAAS